MKLNDNTHSEKKINSVGFIGLGNIGRPVAKNLVGNDFEVVVWDVSQQALDTFNDLDAVIADTRREMGRRCDIIGICVRDDADVKEVILGEDGLLAEAGPGTIIAIHSTIKPKTVKMLAKIAAEKGVHIIDVPVTGGPHKAAEGDLCYMAGGEKEIVERCRKVFEHCASKIVHVGDLGMGMAAKLCNNLITYLQLTAATESMILARHANIPDEAIDEITDHNGNMTESMKLFLGLRRVSDGMADDKGLQDMLRSYTQLAEKDLKLALDYAFDLGIALPATGLCQQIMGKTFGLADTNRR